MTILTQGSEATTTRGLSVEFEDIHQRSIHGDRPVRALNLNLSTGSSEFVSIVGPSGCGKTTALSMTVGLAGRGPGRRGWKGRRSPPRVWPSGGRHPYRPGAPTTPGDAHQLRGVPRLLPPAR